MLLECEEKINSIATRNYLHIVYLPGYKVVEGNEMNDQIKAS